MGSIDEHIAEGARLASQNAIHVAQAQHWIGGLDDDALLAAYVEAERGPRETGGARVVYGCLVQAVRQRIPAQRVLAALNEAESKEGEA
jgi:hypothetical protein